MLTSDPERESKLSIQRLRPRIEKELSVSISADPQAWQKFSERLRKHFPSLFNLYLGYMALVMIYSIILKICC